MTYIIYILSGVFILFGLFGLFYTGPKKLWVTLASCVYMGAGIIAFQILSLWPLVIGFTLNIFLKLSGLEPTDAEVCFSSVNNNTNQSSHKNQKTIILAQKIKAEFINAAKSKRETLSENELENITIKMLMINEMSGEDFFEEHLSYEVQKYISEGLREDYKT